MRVLHRFTTEPHECEYLPGRTATLEYSLAASLSSGEYEDLMNRGYRKFGSALFRPVCDACQECRPIRIPVARFQPDRSQRRAWQRNQDLEVHAGPPVLDEERLDLYGRYHAAQAVQKGWPEKDADPANYRFSFVQNPIPSIELTLWEQDVLRGVVLNDVTPHVLSAIYHYYDPELSGRSLGTFGLLQTIELARRLGKPWVYFGFYVAGCRSMSYKARYRPCEILGIDGVWREPEP